MCGFFGTVNSNFSDLNLIKLSLSSISHRGPDNNSIWSSKNNKIILGHNRLSIIDLSDNASQPMFDEENLLTIVFNGEIYNYQKLKEKLSNFYKFKTNSDTEVILKAYSHWGRKCLNHFNGMFSFAIYDQKKNIIFAARDRSGQKPFYYFYDGKIFSFCSELKAITSSLKKKLLLINSLSLNCLFEFGYIPKENCIFHKFYKLPPANYLIYDLKSNLIEKNEYWSPLINKNINKKFKLDDYKKNFYKIFDESIKRHIVSDVPVGVLLSGGIDSSLVTAFASKNIKNLKTFTVSFPNQGKFNESIFAKSVSNYFDTDHHEIEISNDFNPEKVLPLLAKQFDEPIFDSSLLPTFLVCKEVSKYCKVVMGGDGADELFGGYHHHQRILISQHIKKILPHFLWKKLSMIAKVMPNGVRGKTWVESLKFDLRKELPNVASFFNDADRKNLLKEFYNDQSSNIRKNNFFDRGDLLDKILWTDFKNYLSEDILVKTDRSSMLNSLELRAPFLDNEMIEFAEILPNRYKVNRYEKKIFLKNIAKELLPKNLELNRKQGFSIPVNDWIRNNKIWKNYFEHILFDLDYDFLDKKMVEKLYIRQKKGLHLGEKIFGIVMFILWQKNYLT